MIHLTVFLIFIRDCIRARKISRYAEIHREAFKTGLNGGLEIGKEAE